MDLFVYDWFYTGYNVYGHCLTDNGEYKLLTVNNFYPYCFYEGEQIPTSSIAPVKITYKKMVSSLNIAEASSYYQIFFKNTNQMNKFVAEHKYKTFMHDIPHLTTFLAQINAKHIGWVRVPDICVNSPDDITIINDRLPYAHPKIMVFDIEVQSSDSGMPQPWRLNDSIEMISIVFHCNKETKTYLLHKMSQKLNLDNTTEILCDGEFGIIDEFFKLIKLENPTILTGFNIYSFDINYIVSRLKLRLRNIPDVSRGLPGYMKLISVDWQSDAYGYNQYDRLVIGGRIILDMYLYFKRLKLDKYSLDFISHKFINEGKNDMDNTEMNNAFKTNNLDKLKLVAQYCIQDSMLVLKLFDKVQMWIDVCEISKITACGIEDIYTRGEQMKLISQCIKECINRNIVLKYQPGNSNWDRYEGAYVLEPEKGIYNKCTVLDFQSLYPSIIIAYNICPSTYISTSPTIPHHNVENHNFRKEPIGMLPQMIKQLLEERKAVKALMKNCGKSTMEYTVYDRRQNALKICANSVYGMMGFKNSRYFGHLPCAESVTTVGRNCLADVIFTIENAYPVKIVYGDTDSCMVWYNSSENMTKQEIIDNSYDICKTITSVLPKPMALQFESYFDKIILLTKKRYILVNDDTILYKGVMNARRDYCKYAKCTYENIIKLIATGETAENILKYIDKQLLKLYTGQYDISDLVIIKSISKDIKAYKTNQPQVIMAKRLIAAGEVISPGTRLEFVFVKEFDAQGDKMRTLDEVKNMNLSIDVQFYIKKQLCTQIEDILSVLGKQDYITTTWLF